MADRVKASPVISVVLPAYLEEENLRILLPRIRTALEGWDGGFEVVVVDTRWPLDSTASVAAAHAARCVPRAPRNTFGDAVRTGIAAARGDWILFMDADGSHPPEFIPRLLDRLDDADVVVASRYVDGGYTENSWPLRTMSRLVNEIYAIVLGIPCNDISNSFKAYRAELIRPLHLRCSNFDVIEEILYKLVRNDRCLRIVEVPFSFKKRMFGDTKRSLFAFALTYLITLFRLRFGRGAR